MSVQCSVDVSYAVYYLLDESRQGALAPITRGRIELNQFIGKLMNI